MVTSEIFLNTRIQHLEIFFYSLALPASKGYAIFTLNSYPELFHMYKIFLLMITLSPLLYSCNQATNTTAVGEKAKTEIAQAEKDFEKMAAEKGIAEAFWFYADSNAVIKRNNDTIIHNKENIKGFYSNDFYKSASVKWSPDFIDASADGSMGYTYGKYLWQSKDSTGKPIEFRGVFHTVWKKQPDGSWKYVWD